MSATTQPWPTLIRLDKAKGMLEVAFDSGDRFELPAEYLRVHSQSAEVKGHGAGPRAVVGGKKNVKIRDLEGVGNYAVRIVFDDGHDSGLYTWDYLHALGAHHAKNWALYLEQLAAKGLTRG